MSEFLLTNEAARVLSVAPSTVLHYERTGQLAAMRTQGGVRLFRRIDVERFKNQRDIKRQAEVRAS